MSNAPKPKQPKVQATDYISVSSSEDWFEDNLNDAIYDDTFHRIIDFYVLHSPCKSSSYSPKSLEKLGWKNPWNSSKFREAFDEICDCNNTPFFQHLDSKNKLKTAWETSGYEWIPEKPEHEFAIYVSAGESNLRIDLMHRIRNALAHGRFTKKTHNKQDYLLLEDVGGVWPLKGLFVHARICIKTKTLVDWIDLFEKKGTKAAELSYLYSAT